MVAQNGSNGADFPPLPGDVEPAKQETVETVSAPPRPAAELRDEEAEILRPTVERAILLSGRNNNTVLASALSTVVGSALRRSIAGVFKRAIVALNRFLVLSFSVEGIRWRFEAFRTGKPFKQVVDEHSLICPVTQVFLIHRGTGLLIGQVQQGSSESQDGDMVSSMLTAIQDFVHDSFRTEAAGELEVIRIGDVTVLLEQGPFAILAGIITQGFAPQNLRDTFRRALGQIHDDYHESLLSYKGDAGALDEVTPILEACLKTRLVKGEDKISPLTGVVLLVPLVMLAVWGTFEVRQSIRWHQYLKELSTRPGIVVVESGRRGKQRYVRGLRDPLADDPVGMLVDAGIVPDEIVSEWQPYHALSPELVLERARRTLSPPQTVSLELRNSVLIVEGTAPWEWVESLASKIAGEHGISRVRAEGVERLGAEERDAWNRYLERLAQTPGLLVLEKGRWNGSFYIAGMRDPLAPDPVAMASDAGLPRERIQSKWEVYQALHPDLVMARAREMLEPPAGVTMQMEGGVLKISGSAPHAWISEARLLARGCAGISRFDDEDLVDTDYEEYKAVVPKLEGQIFYYLVNRRDLWPGQDKKYRQFVADVRRFARVVRRLGAGQHIEIRGHSRATGDDEVDQSASEAIADRFYSRLAGQRLDMALFLKRGMGGEPAPAAAPGR